MFKPSNIKYLFLILILSFTVLSQDKNNQIDALVQQYYEMGQINGSVLVAEGGNVIFSNSVGYSDIEKKIENKPDTKFRLASVTKQFTATLIMQLVEKGKLSLEGKLSEYLPYYRKDIGDKVTIHQLLNHTSGIPGYTELPGFMTNEVSKKVEVKDFVIKFCSNDLSFEPGTKWSYNNSGYFILGAVIEEVTGKTYEAVLKENILEPLGMANSGYDHSDMVYENKSIGYTGSFAGIQSARFIDMSIPYAAGSMYSTVEDMYKWDQALYTEKILKNESKEKMFTPGLNNYGYGWGISEIAVGDVKKKVNAHSGGIFGFNTLIVRYPEDKHLIVILNNFDDGGATNELSKRIRLILYGLEVPPPQQSAAKKLYKTFTEKGMEEANKEFNVNKENKTDYFVSESEMNNLGYYLLGQDKVNEAIEVFKLNVEAFPESFNVYDSLGEAYLAAGDKENAKINYKKSVELNPQNQSGIEALKKLEEVR
ncbi:MAG TPA: serine hydrolase [Ignavibacteria bacterium]|nr:serine hydrolase [Ignavibacteria bacterium]